MQIPEFDWKKSVYLEGDRLYTNNGKYVGDVVQDVDGCFVYFPETNGGFWSDSILLCIGAMLYEMNKPYYDELDAFFESRD